MTRYSLSALNRLVREVIEDCLDSAYWVEAEISDISTRRGHCYLELIEKDATGNTPVAKARATCWANVWAYVSANFIEVTGTALRSGMKVLLCVRPTFHEAFGFAWNVMDIDPTFTLGDMQRRREQIIKALKESGVFGLQKELSLSAFAKNIAVVSAADAAGYGDFCNQLHTNPFGFVFNAELFPAVMQGEQVEQSVIAALDRIYQRQDDFDCVVIIRGGGATSDMSGFDTLLLAENVANFPLPIITGIGHDRDTCVLDLISYMQVKTPTAAAVMLIDNLSHTMERIEEAKERIERAATRRLLLLKTELAGLSARIPTLFSLVKTRQEAMLIRYIDRAETALSKRMDSERYRLDILSNRVKGLDPAILLNRGYSITMLDGKVLTSASQVKAGSTIETRLKDGTLISKVMKPA